MIFSSCQYITRIHSIRNHQHIYLFSMYIYNIHINLTYAPLSTFIMIFNDSTYMMLFYSITRLAMDIPP